MSKCNAIAWLLLMALPVLGADAEINVTNLTAAASMANTDTFLVRTGATKALRVVSAMLVPSAGSNVVGAVSAATGAANATNFWGSLTITNLPAGLSTSNYVGTFAGDGTVSNAVASTYVTTATLTNAVAGPGNAKYYGAAGNGIANDTAALTLALAAVGSGGTLFIPRGNYKVDNLTVTQANLTIKGETQIGTAASGGTAANGTIILATGNFTTPTINIQADGVTLDGLWIAGSDVATNCVRMVDRNNVTVKNCVIKGATGAGLLIKSSVPLTTTSFGVTLNRIYSYGNGIGAALDQATLVTISESTFTANTNYGVYFTNGVELCKVADSTISANGTGFKFIDDGRNNVIESTLLSGNTNFNGNIDGQVRGGTIKHCWFEELPWNTNSIMLYFTNTAGLDRPFGWLIEDCRFSYNNAARSNLGIIGSVSRSSFRNLSWQTADTNGIQLTATSTNNLFWNLVNNDSTPFTLATPLAQQGRGTMVFSDAALNVSGNIIGTGASNYLSGSLTVAGSLNIAGGSDPAVFTNGIVFLSTLTGLDTSLTNASGQTIAQEIAADVLAGTNAIMTAATNSAKSYADAAVLAGTNAIMTAATNSAKAYADAKDSGWTTNASNIGVVAMRQAVYTNITGNISWAGFSGTDPTLWQSATIVATNSTATDYKITFDASVSVATNTFTLGNDVWVTNKTKVIIAVGVGFGETNVAANRFNPR